MRSLREVKGPHRAAVLDLVAQAHGMSQEEAERVARSWAADDGDLEGYYSACERVCEALEETGRTLPRGWFEKEFAETSWVRTTRALHAVADAISGALVADAISGEDCHLMTRHFREAFQYA